MRQDIYKDGIKTQFSSTHQPTTEQRKKAWSYRKAIKEKLKKQFDPMLNAIVEKIIENGDSASLERLLNRAYGPMTNKHEINMKGSLYKVLRDQFFDE